MTRWLVCRQCRGDLGELYTGWRRLLLEARARIEAHLDFGEEGHEQIPDVSGQVDSRVRAVVEAMTRHLRDSRRGELVRGGVRLAILGRPNAGKSTCLNALLRRPAAIVSPIPGTTRDVVSGTLDLAGLPVQVLDTAGLRRTQDVLEHQGVTRAMDTARDAHAVLFVLDAREVLDSVVLEDTRTQIGSYTGMDDKRLISPSGQEANCNLFPKIENSPPMEGDERSTTYIFNVDKFVSSLWNDLKDDKLDLCFSEMDWFIEGNYVILMNKIDLLTSNELSILEKISFIRSTASDTLPETLQDCTANTSLSSPSVKTSSQDEDSHVASSLRTAATVVPVSLTRGDRLDRALHALEEVCARLCASDSQQEEVPMLTTARHRIHVTAALRSLLAVTGQKLESSGTRDKASVRLDRNDESIGMNLDHDHNITPNCSETALRRGNESSAEIVSNGKGNLLQSEDTLVAAAHYLHQATRHLGHVTGDVTTEHVLDQIFKEFCIGK